MKIYFLCCFLIPYFNIFANNDQWGTINNGIRARVKECIVKIDSYGKSFELILNVEVENTSNHTSKFFIKNYNSQGRFFKAISQGKEISITEMNKLPVLQVHLWAEVFGIKKEYPVQKKVSEGSIGNLYTFINPCGSFGNCYNDNMDISMIKILPAQKGNIKMSFIFVTDLYGYLLEKEMPLYLKFKSSIFTTKKEGDKNFQNIWEGELITKEFYIPSQYLLTEKSKNIYNNSKEKAIPKEQEDYNTWESVPEIIFKEGIAYKKGAYKPFSGTLLKYYSNKKIKSQVPYLNGLKHGSVKKIGKDGKKYLQIDMKCGIVISITKYFPNGQIMWKEQYSPLQEEGKFTSWYKTGKKKHELIPIPNSKKGKELWWDEKGNLIAEGTYLKKEHVRQPQNGTFIIHKNIETFKNGKIVRSIEIPYLLQDEPRPVQKFDSKN